MDDLGKYLKAARKEQKVSVDEVGSHTKIPIRFVQAMEDNRFDQLPNVVSAKGFLRGYAQFLNLDITEICEAFDEIFDPQKKRALAHEKQDEILSHLQVKRSSRLPFPRRVLFLVGGVILLLLIFVGLLPERKDAQRSPSPPPLLEEQVATNVENPLENGVLLEEAPITETAPAIEKAVSAPSEETPIQEVVEVESPKIKPEALKTKEKFVASVEVNPEEKEKPVLLSENETPIISPTETPSMHLLYVEAIEPTWVQVEIDEDEIREALLQPNDSIRWKAKEKFLLKVGNAGGVKVLLNGEELDPLGPSGEVVEKEIVGTTEQSE